MTATQWVGFFLFGVMMGLFGAQLTLLWDRFLRHK